LALTPVPWKVTTNFSFLYLAFELRTQTGQTDKRTDGQGPYCGLLVPQNNNIIRHIRSCRANDSAYRLPAHFSVAWSVCLSVICHIRAPCLNRSTDLDAIWQVHLWGPVTHCVRWGSLTAHEKGEIWGSNPAAGTCNYCNCSSHLANKNNELHELATAVPPLTKLRRTC